jgi:tetratricopeptide (TPR) repeat protein
MLLASDITSVGDKAHAWQVTALCAAQRGDEAATRSAGERAQALIEEFGLTSQRGVSSMDLGSAAALVGDLEEAERILRRGNDALDEMGDTGARCTVAAMLADVLVQKGDPHEAVRFAAQSREIAAADDLDAQPRWRAAMARALSLQGDHGRAERFAREAAELVEPIDLLLLKGAVLDALGEVLERAGKADEANVVLERAVAVHEQKGNAVSALRTRAARSHVRARS